MLLRSSVRKTKLTNIIIIFILFFLLNGCAATMSTVYKNPFPEVKPRFYNKDYDLVFDAILKTAKDMEKEGWKISDIDSELSTVMIESPHSFWSGQTRIYMQALRLKSGSIRVDVVTKLDEDIGSTAKKGARIIGELYDSIDENINLLSLQE